MSNPRLAALGDKEVGVAPAEIREPREHLGWTPEQLADEVGVSAMAVRRWELGTSRPTGPVLTALIRLANRVEADPSDT